MNSPIAPLTENPPKALRGYIIPRKAQNIAYHLRGAEFSGSFPFKTDIEWLTNRHDINSLGNFTLFLKGNLVQIDPEKQPKDDHYHLNQNCESRRSPYLGNREGEIGLSQNSLVELENETRETLEQKISGKLQKANDWKLDPPKSRAFSNELFVPHLNALATGKTQPSEKGISIEGLSNQDIIDIAKEFNNEIKKTILKLIYYYMILLYNTALSFDIKLLDNLGFDPCMNCVNC